MAQRDQALIKILERLAGEMTQQDKMLGDLLERQNSLAKSVEAAGLHLRGGQTDTERSYDKLLEAMNRYRSDMLSLVREQDRINKNLEDLEKVLKLTTYSVDVTGKKLIEMNELLSRIENSSASHYEYTAKQQTSFQSFFAESARDMAALRADTEKQLSQFRGDIDKRLDSFRHETMKHLLLLDSIIPSLEVLLIRTAPPEKKPVLVVRLLINLRDFFRYKAAAIFKKKPGR